MNVFLACFLAVLLSQFVNIAWRAAHNWWLFRNVAKGELLTPSDYRYEPLKMHACTECGANHPEMPPRCECKACGSKHVHGRGLPVIGGW